jgi:hypothetical protein
MTVADDARRFAPATLRNRDPILDVLRTVLPTSGVVLEVASGSGEHVVHFARHLPTLQWQPTDPSPDALQSIAAWVALREVDNILPPIALDAAQSPWPVEQAAAVLCINMIHISPWQATVGLMRGAGEILASGSPLYLYGPYRRPGLPLEPGNAAFDQDLKARDSRWGLRDLDAVIDCAAAHDLGFEQCLDMPANNMSVVFRKR